MSATPWTATAPVNFQLTFSELVTTPVLVATGQQQALKVTVLGIHNYEYPGDVMHGQRPPDNMLQHLHPE